MVAFPGPSLVKLVLNREEIVERHGGLWFEGRRKYHDDRTPPPEEPRTVAEIPCECEGTNENCYRCAGSGYYRRSDAAPLRVTPTPPAETPPVNFGKPGKVTPAAKQSDGNEGATEPSGDGHGEVRSNGASEPNIDPTVTDVRKQWGRIEHVDRDRGLIMLAVEDGNKYIWNFDRVAPPAWPMRPGRLVEVVTRTKVSPEEEDHRGHARITDETAGSLEGMMALFGVQRLMNRPLHDPTLGPQPAIIPPG